MVDLDTSEDDECDAILENLYDDLSDAVIFRYGSRNSVPKSKDWIHNILPSNDDNRFKIMLRVSRIQFRLILEEIENDSIFHGHNSCQQFPVPMQLSIVLYRLGIEGGSTKKTAAQFGIGDGGTINKITLRIFKAILKLKEKFLDWPSADERKKICEATNHELPGCVGYLDGSEIRLAEAPSSNHDDYFSRKQQYSIKIQAICDYTTKIRYVTIGYPGSVHDARIYAECALAQNVSSFLSDQQWIAADSAYKLSETIITPYRKNSNETNSRQRKDFNKYFSSFRVRIEHCFGRLKERFGSLKEMRINLHSRHCHMFFCDWVMACCILHNIILPESTEDEFEYELENDDDIVLISEQISNSIGELRRQLIYETRVVNNEN